ncbi:hypothetical protein EV128_124125 [Rhizobium azibense]|nr:hypothetical protein EV128_124125 [Rhizobium azibense]
MTTVLREDRFSSARTRVNVTAKQLLPRFK